MRGRSPKKKFSKCAFIALILASSLTGLVSAENNDTASVAKVTEIQSEKLIRQSIGALLDNRPKLSLNHTLSLLEKHGNFRLGKLLSADLRAAQAHQNVLLATEGALEKARIKGMVEEAYARLHYRHPLPGRLPDAISQLSDLHAFALLIDVSRARLYVFANDNGTPRIKLNHYISTGNGGGGKSQEGDEKTPLGVYHLMTYLDGKTLPELYGTGAYPINYPNRWDQLHDRRGYGIWLHGTPPKVYSRPPKDSRGCIVISNQIIDELAAYIDPGHTPIVITEKARWLTAKDWEATRRELLQSIEQWQKDWQSLDIERYLTHYSQNYKTSEKNYAQMVKASRANAKKKTFVEIEIKDIDLFDYPQERDTMIAIFDQDYRSNNYSIRYRKQQLWRYENDRWKIIFEGSAETKSPT